VFHGTSAETDHRSARQTHALGLSLPQETLEEVGRVLLASETPFWQHTWATLVPPPELFETLHRRLMQLLSMEGTVAWFPAPSETHRVEQECLRVLVAALAPAATAQPRLRLPVRSQIVRRAEEFMRERLSIPLSAIDVCRELGVSDRTLRLAFSERYGLGPMAYCKRLRLNAVRSRLQGEPATVAQVAREYGFHHLGNFAADYRRLFGESPSTTLKRTVHLSNTD
jgi:AraC family ethanolamine operon transcriptional activator